MPIRTGKYYVVSETWGQLLLRRGIISAGQYQLVKKGKTVEVKLGGNIQSSPRLTGLRIEGEEVPLPRGGVLAESGKAGGKRVPVRITGRETVTTDTGRKTTVQLAGFESRISRSVNERVFFDVEGQYTPPTPREAITITTETKPIPQAQQPSALTPEEITQAPLKTQAQKVFEPLFKPTTQTQTQAQRAFAPLLQTKATAEAQKPITTTSIIGTTAAELTLGELGRGAKGFAELSFYPIEKGLQIQEKLYPKATAKAKMVQEKLGFNLEKMRNDLTLKKRDVTSFALLSAVGLGTATQAGRIAITEISAGLSASNIIGAIKAPTKTEKLEKITTAAFFAVPAVPGLAAGTRLAAARTFGKFVPPETVFDPKVLAGKSIFPETTSPVESLKEFAKRGDVVHTTAVRLQKAPGGGLPIQEGIRPDPGLFVTPKGRGSPFFLRQAGEGVPEFKLVPEVKFPKVIVVEGAGKGVRRLPKDILLSNQKAAAGFIKSRAGTGEILITPGSEAAFNRKIAQTLGRRGTREIESVIPPNQILEPVKPKSLRGKILGFEEFTIVEGEAVPIMKFKLGEIEFKTTFVDAVGKKGLGLSGRGRVTRPQVGVSSLFVGSRLNIRPMARLPTRTITSRIARPTTTSRGLERSITRELGRVTERPGTRQSSITRPPGRISTTIRTPGMPTSRVTRTTVRPFTVRAVGFPGTTRVPTRPITPPPETPVIKLPKLKLAPLEGKDDLKLRRMFKFLPSLVAVEGKIYGKRPKRLTGVEIRPIGR